MANSIETAKLYTDELDKMLVQKSVVGFLADNAMRAKFMGAKTVLIPDVEMQGLGDYSRATGYVDGDVSLKYTPYELTRDRGRSFSIDKEEADEGGVPRLMGAVMGEFVRTKAVPEINAYALSKLAKFAKDATQTIEGAPENGAFDMLIKGFAKAQDAAGYGEELVAFVNSDLYAAINADPKLSRMIMVKDFSSGDVHTQVKALNDVALLPVQNALMQTQFDFKTGGGGQEAGGFTPNVAAENVNLLVMPKKAAMLVKKTDDVRIFDPSINQDKNAWKGDYRVYFDLFIKKSYEKTIFVNTTSK